MIFNETFKNRLKKRKITYIINIYYKLKLEREGSDFYENKNNRKGTKDNRSNKRLC